MVKVVLLACGSFNPPTKRHVDLFELARTELEKLGYDVCGRYMSPVHDGYKKPGLVDASHRVTMCEMATKGTDIVVDPWESQQDEYQPTLKVLLHVLQSLHADTRVMLLCGADLLESMTDSTKWPVKDIHELLSTFGVVCVCRNGTDLDEMLSSGILATYRENIIPVLDEDPGSVSSSMVRARVKEQQQIDALVHPSVNAYIVEKNLYKT